MLELFKLWVKGLGPERNGQGGERGRQEKVVGKRKKEEWRKGKGTLSFSSLRPKWEGLVSFKRQTITDSAERFNWYLLGNPEWCTSSLCNPALKRGSQLYEQKRTEEKKSRTKNRKQHGRLKVIFLKGQHRKDFSAPPGQASWTHSNRSLWILGLVFHTHS